MPVNKKVVGILFSIGCLITILFAICLSWDRGRIKIGGIENLVIDSNTQFSVDSIEVRDSITITGWALQRGETALNCDVILRGAVSGEVYQIPTQIQEREDINQVYSDGIDYKNAGFLAKVRRAKLRLDQEDYEIFLQYEQHGIQYTIPTGKIVSCVRRVSQATGNAEEISIGVDLIIMQKKILTVNGWALKAGIDGEQSKITVLIRNTRTSELYTIPTVKKDRADLNEIFQNADYTKSGFQGSVETWRFDLGYDIHEIGIRYEANGVMYDVFNGYFLDPMKETGENDGRAR